MKTNRSIYLVLVIALAILAWWLLKPDPDVREMAKPPRPEPKRASNTNSFESPESTVPRDRSAKTDPKLKDEYELLNHRPIEFYGKAVDQFGNPVPNAEVRCSAIIRTGEGSGMEKHATRTDAAGKFEFRGFSGESIGLAVSKPGYLRESERTANSFFVYSLFYGDRVHKPDPNNPVVFKMWKLAGPEPMIEGQKFFKIKPNGPEYTIDLVNGKKIEGKIAQGDFIVRVHRPAIVSPRDRYDWSFEIEPVDGGIIETDDPFPYLAPETSYKPNYLHVVTASQTNWSYNARKLFYIKSRAGRVHARVQVAVYADYPDGSALDIKYFLNPSGSRNLEYDPKKRLTKDEIAKLGFGTTTNGQSQ